MKVLLTHELFPPDFAGGGEYIALETARNLMRHGVDVQVLTTGEPAITSYEGTPTARLPMHRYRFNLATSQILELARNADLIHTFNYHACLSSLRAGRRLGKPVVCVILGLFQNAWKEMRPGLAGHARILWERFLVTRPFNRLIFLSEYSRKTGVALGAPPARSLVNCPGIYVDQYCPAAQKEDVVLFVGKLEVRKGILDLLEVARLLPAVRFRVFGWGPDEAAVRAAAPSNIEFVGFERGEKLRDMLARARIFFFPSKAETFGIALVEAMASGCAVVSTVPLEFEGAHVSPGDRQSMVEAVSTLWDDRETSTAMGMRNRELAQAYSWEQHVACLLDTYQAVLRENGA